MNKKDITVSKTARYFTLGEANDETRCVWFICHGYGHLANYFLQNFEILNNDKNLLVAPEGLHRFYLNGYSGRVGASWMTKEERLNDIKDYTNFLDDVYKEIISSFKGRAVKVNVLGFSQGAATVCRWLCNNKSKADNLILWAGAFPDDLKFEADKAVFDSMNIHLVIGDKDEFITSEQVEEQEKTLKQNGIKFQLLKFDGKHEIKANVLKEISEKM